MRNINMSYYKVYYYCDIIDRLLYRFTGSIDWASTGAQFTEPFLKAKLIISPNILLYIVFVNLQ